MYLCYQEPAPGYISKLISARRALSPRLPHRLQLLLSCLHFTTACCPGPGFAEELFFLDVHAQSTASVPVPPCSCAPRGPQLAVFPEAPMPSQPLLFLHRLAIQVHTQERAIQVRTQECAIQVHTQERAIQVHTQNVLSKCTLRMCYPSALSERAIQVHTQERAIQVHTQNVLSKCMVYSCTTRAPPISCTSRTCAPLVHHLYSCTHLVHFNSRAPNSCTHLVHHQSRAPNSYITRTRAPISCTSTLVHLYSRAPISCTTNLVHYSCTAKYLLNYSTTLNGGII